MVVPTFYRRTRLAREILGRLRRNFPTELSNRVVGYNVKIDEAQSHGLAIFEYAPTHPAARTMAALGDELLLRSPMTKNQVHEHGDSSMESNRLTLADDPLGHRSATSSLRSSG